VTARRRRAAASRRPELRRLEIREISPGTPTGRPSKGVAGDPIEIRATIVRDGHGVLACRARWRRVDRPRAGRWSSAPLREEEPTRFRGLAIAGEPGLYEVVVEAWSDRFATWRRDLRARLAAGDDVEVHLEVGARLLEDLATVVAPRDSARVADAVAGLRDARCAVAVRVAAGLDDAVARLLEGVPDPVEAVSADPVLVRVDRELAVRGAWYELFPRSEGGFREGSPLWRRLDDVAAMGFDVLYLPPVHPIGTTHRKGRDNTLVAGPGDVGSPWAIGAAEGGHTALHPDLGTMADFDAFVAAAGESGIEVALDYALQCSPDHPWVDEHPEWFTRLPDGSIQYAENPPKKYQDIYPLNFWPERDEDRVALWEACEEILEFWIGHGIGVFRVDNPHTKPVAFWEWLIPRVQARHPEVVLLAEAFSTPAMMHTLAEVGFSQGYTYFTWRHTAEELRSYAEELAHGPAAGWFRPNLWPNTPDILEGVLRGGPPAAFRLRSLLAALLAPSWGVYSGFELCENEPASPENTEYLHSEKYELRRRDFSEPDSLAGWLATLNRIRREHPATHRMGSLRFHHVEGVDVLAWSHRRNDPAGHDDRLVVVANLDPAAVREAMVHLDPWSLGLDPDARISVRDELDGTRYEWRAGANYVRLDPAVRVAHVLSVEAH
jgi:starch synthase (maltosyl-transferring)